MRVAILSDVHANAFALEAVQAHARQRGANACWFLGDAVGYGPHSEQAVEFLRGLAPEHWVPGNHDAVFVQVLDVKTVNGQAKESHDRNRAALAQRPDLETWMRESFPAPVDWVRRIVRDDDLYVLVHGALYRDPEAPAHLVQEMNQLLPPDQQLDCKSMAPLHHLMLYMWPWLLPGDFLRELECVSLLRGETTGRACVFSGHTHVPQFWYLDGAEAGAVQAVRRRIVYEEPCTLPDKPALVNPGSVGQPRDGDPRAAYALLDCEAGTVTFYRVPYPVEKTKRDMARQNYPVFLQQRLSRAHRPDDWPPGFEL